jgi:6-pyruvoyltetrahydropterin/6-carboxytetrahydropterin synthase
MSITITRVLEFDYGHRLIGHESKCRNVHGHRGVIEVEVTAPDLDQVGRIIDFSVIKAELGGWIDAHWDHGFVYQAGDPIEEFLVANDQRRYMMAAPPTAENLALLFKSVAVNLMAQHGIDVVSVKLWETPNCFALVR